MPNLDAPSVRRIAVSRCRTAARASIRFATFAHTIATVSIVMTEKIARNVEPRVATTLLPPAVTE